MDNIKKLLLTEDYDFLRTSEHLGENICMLALGGSLAYGTNIEGKSDIDVRGIATERPHELIGFKSFEQYIDNPTDTVIYGFNKMIKLLMDNNPNIIEILGCKPEHYLYLNDIGIELIKNSHVFLSQKAAATFNGYAFQQFNKMRQVVPCETFDDGDALINSFKGAMLTFPDRYPHFTKGSISFGKSEENAVVADVNLSKYPVAELNGVFNELMNIFKTYDKVNHRNNKKDDYHINKHAMHLIRLYMMGTDILEKEKIITYREDERELLLDIRNGKYMNPDGKFNSAFFDLKNEYEKRFIYAKENTSLPVRPDYDKIEEFVMEVNAKIIREGYDNIKERNHFDDFER